MLDAFLAAALRSSSAEQEKRAFIDNLKKLPDEELKKLASGELKLSHFGCDNGQEWLEKYKGTPLFEQAVALEQQDIQNEVARVQQQIDRPPFDEFYRTGDQIRLQKRLLDLQLFQQEAAPASPEAPAQGAGAPGAGAVNNEEAMSPGPDNGMKTSGAKVASSAVMGVTPERYNHYADHMNDVISKNGGGLSEAEHDRHTEMYNKKHGTKIPMLAEYKARLKEKTGQAAFSSLKEKIAMADGWGRDLAKNDAKVALSLAEKDHAEKKAALNLAELGKRLKGGATAVGSHLKDLNIASGGRMAKAAPIGALVGGLGGAASGLQTDEKGETHVLRNALLGAGGGAALGAGGSLAHVGMSAGQGLGESLKGVGRQAKLLGSAGLKGFQGAG